MSNLNTTGFVWDTDRIVEDLLRKSDETVMPLPSFESEPHLLMSKIRRHYFEYMIKLLSLNYENYQMLVNKNIHLPSAIWKCAKFIETNAASASMVVDLYRKNIITMIKEIKNDTKKGKLNKGLYHCLQRPYDSEKKTQTTLNMSTTCTCQCTCNGKRKKLISGSPKNNGQLNNIPQVPDLSSMSNNRNIEEQYKIPTVINNQIEPPQVVPLMQKQNVISNNNTPQAQTNNHNHEIRMSIESHDSAEDQVMLQLEQLFRTDSNDDDLFEGTFKEVDTSNCESTEVKQDGIQRYDDNKQVMKDRQSCLVNEQADKIKSLDERLALLESSGMLSGSQTSKAETQTKPVKHFQSFWLCEMYFQKVKLFETLDEIRDSNRRKHARIKNNFTVLFGEDSDDEQVLSPLEETPEFVLSCKERIAPWIIKILSPQYVKGRIRGKILFKSVARHLIRLIYQCSRYPSEYEVHSFVTDFLKSHPIIRCEADFRQFKINNI